MRPKLPVDPLRCGPPGSQAILLDTFPTEKQGAAQALFGIAALLAPVIGPTLGGY